MYKKAKIKTALLYAFGALAVTIALGMIVFMVHTLRLRTEYRDFCLEINNAVLTSPKQRNTVTRGDETAPLSFTALNYYDQFLLDTGTLVYSRKSAEPTEKSIVISMKGGTLFFIPLDQETICLRWDTPSGTRSYRVRAGYITFADLHSYLTIYLQSLPKEG